MHNAPTRQLPTRHWRIAGGLFVVALTLLSSRDALAQDPPIPDFFWPYGIVSVDGGNIEPAIQPVVALVNGRVCGTATTTIALPGPGVPPSDLGRTVYVVDILAAGTNAGQLPGCGTPGAPVTFWFPVAQRLAVEQPAFQQGGHRVNLSLGPELSFRLQGPMISNDGLP
ncbi:MAG TPA: hypothetical protein PKD27_02530 [Tepidiformaceae bacterium]|nr:hypothetical protein [Tepidiformaceae bacterium]